MQYAMRNLHPERLFTVRPLKVFAYILTAHVDFVHRRFKLHRYYISDAPNVRRSPLTGKTVASIDYHTSHSSFECNKS